MDTPNVGIPEQLARRLSMPEQHEYLRARFSRRRALTGTAASLGGLTLLGGSASSAYAAPSAASSPAAPVRSAAVRVDGSLVAPFARHLAFGADPKTQMRISWQVPFAVRKPFVRVGLRPWDLSRKIEAVEQLYLHAALDGLTPGTTYYYGVGHDGFDPASAERIATIGSFRTAPAKAERFVFTAFGDQGVSYDALANDQLILGQNPRSICTPATSATPTAAGTARSRTRTTRACGTSSSRRRSRSRSRCRGW